jgi:hypothetical protein
MPIPPDNLVEFPNCWFLSYSLQKYKNTGYLQKESETDIVVKSGKIVIAKYENTNKILSIVDTVGFNIINSKQYLVQL